MGRLTLSNGCVSGLLLSLRKEGLVKGRIDCCSSTVQASCWLWRVTHSNGVDIFVFIAVRCKRLVDRDASLTTTALMSLSFIAVRCQRLVVYVTTFCDGSFGVVAVRCQLFLCPRRSDSRRLFWCCSSQLPALLVHALQWFATAAFLSLIELVDAPLVELIKLSWVVADWSCRKEINECIPGHEP